jgi:hypothetical protein
MAEVALSDDCQRVSRLPTFGSIRTAYARSARERLGPFNGLDIAPIVGWTFNSRWPVGQPKQVRCAKFGIAGAAALGNLNKPERHAFPNSGTNCVAVNAVLMKVLIRDRQVAIVLAAVVRELDLEAIKHAARR